MKKLVDNMQFISILVFVGLSFFAQVKGYGNLEEQVRIAKEENARLSAQIVEVNARLSGNIADLSKEVKCANESMKEISGYLRGLRHGGAR